MQQTADGHWWNFNLRANWSKHIHATHQLWPLSLLCHLLQDGWMNKFP